MTFFFESIKDIHGQNSNLTGDTVLNSRSYKEFGAQNRVKVAV